MESTLEELVSVVENFTDQGQLALKSALSNILFKKKPVAYSVENKEAVDAGVFSIEDGCLAINPAAKRKCRKLYTYLSRKFDTESYFDPETCDFKEIPKGSEFVIAIGDNGVSELQLMFPDDEITALLDRFEQNRCEGWLSGDRG